MSKQKRIVIIGGGFGGLSAAIECAKRQLGHITLVSKEKVFIHHNTLYSTAIGHDPSESAVPIKNIIAPYPEIYFSHDAITQIDAEAHTVSGASKTYPYDTLIVALGTVGALQTSFHVQPGNIDTNGLAPVKDFQKQFHDLMTAMTAEHGHAVQCAIIGAGPTGVELAGALSSYAKHLHESHQLSAALPQFWLIESSRRILPKHSKTASQKITKKLAAMGVHIVTMHRVDRINQKSIVINGVRNPVDLVLWTHGGEPHPLFVKHPELFKLSKQKRVIVNHYLLAHPDIFVIGDGAQQPDSGLAVAAIDHAKFVARHLSRLNRGQSPRPRRAKKWALALSIAPRWGFVERCNIYAAGTLGSWIRRWFEYKNYRQFLSRHNAILAWKRHKRAQPQCRLCKK